MQVVIKWQEPQREEDHFYSLPNGEFKPCGMAAWGFCVDTGVRSAIVEDLSLPYRTQLIEFHTKEAYGKFLDLVRLYEIERASPPKK